MGERAFSGTEGRLRTSSGVRPKGWVMPAGLRDNLAVAFFLMSVVPLLVMGYLLANYVFPHIHTIWDVSLVAGITLGIALLGLAVIRTMVLPVIRIASQAKAIAAGELEGQVETKGPGEVGELGQALNQITKKVRENMAQLKVYGEQTRHLNQEIQYRVLALSYLLQASNLIAESAKVEEIISFILEKLSQFEEASLNCLLEPATEPGAFLIRAVASEDRAQGQALAGSKVKAPWLTPALQSGRIVVIDSRSAPYERELIQQLTGMTNALCQPLISLGEGMGILISANPKENFTFSEEVIDLLKVFAKQLAIAIENDLLAKRAEELKVLDELTGLYNAGYMKSRLEEEVRRSLRYHRPCSLVVFNLDGFNRFQSLYGALAAEGILCQVAQILKGQVTEVDRVGRVGPDEFALILPERNKREAIELAEAIRHQIEGHVFLNGSQRLTNVITASGGVSENPLDGATGEALFQKAASGVRLAKAQGKNKVVADVLGAS